MHFLTDEIASGYVIACIQSGLIDKTRDTSFIIYDLGILHQKQHH